MFRFSTRSKALLLTCDPRLQKIAELALSWGVTDFAVIEGFREVSKQRELHAQGKSQFDGVNKRSKHNHSPSLAFDLLPSPTTVNGVNVWEDAQRFAVLAGVIYAAGAALGYRVRWGGDWDGDGNNKDSTFHDLPHFELID